MKRLLWLTENLLMKKPLYWMKESPDFMKNSWHLMAMINDHAFHCINNLHSDISSVCSTGHHVLLYGTDPVAQQISYVHYLSHLLIVVYTFTLHKTVQLNVKQDCKLKTKHQQKEQMLRRLTHKCKWRKYVSYTP